jgi:hypothetical protein
MKLIKKITELQKKNHCKIYAENAPIDEFCSSSQLQLSSFNLSINEHANLFDEISRICDGEEGILKNISQNKTIN